MKNPVVTNSIAVVTGIIAFVVGLNLTTLKSEVSPEAPRKNLIRQDLVNQPVVNRGAQPSQTLRKTKSNAILGPENTRKQVEYVVQEGDSVYTIAKNHGTSMKSVMYLNQLTSEKLDIGQKLQVPTYKLELPEDYDPLGMDAKQTQTSQDQTATKQTSANSTKKTKAQTKTPTRVAKASVSRGSTQGAQMLEWSEVRGIFAVGSVATVTDVSTGLTFSVKRKGGTKHADAEPLTAADTEVMKQLYGSWSWERRAIVVQVGNKRIAASMNGMPHGKAIIKDNNFPGHFCIHFLGSQTHGSEYTKSHQATTDSQHQAMIRRAAGK